MSMNLSSRSALLLVDLQRDLCYDARRRDKVFKAIPLIKEAIELFCQDGHLVVYSRMVLDHNDAQFKRFGDKYCIAGTPGMEIIQELLPTRGLVIDKQKHSAFFDTNLHDVLREASVHRLFIAGLQTHICIMTTAADANFRGYDPIAIDECVISSDDDKKRLALNWIEQYVGQVWAFDRVISEFRHE